LHFVVFSKAIAACAQAIPTTIFENRAGLSVPRSELVVRIFSSRALIAAFIIFGSGVAVAQDMTVASMLKDGYAIVGIIPSSAGPGIFLKKGDALTACFVAETPNSASIATKYCKPVK
jgi:hypothetical protein